MKTQLCVEQVLTMNRRDALLGLMTVFAGRALGADLTSVALPSSVAAIEIPRTALTRAAASLSRRTCPEFLFNHCMRTFLFGALHERHHGRTYHAEAAFVAAALHDLGLLKFYETEGRPFEVDSANAAEQLALQNGVLPNVASLIWNAAAMHDMRWAIVEKQNPTVELVAAGASADVAGPDEEMIPRAATEEVLAALSDPVRLQIVRTLVSAELRGSLELGSREDGHRGAQADVTLSLARPVASAG